MISSIKLGHGTKPRVMALGLTSELAKLLTCLTTYTSIGTALPSGLLTITGDAEPSIRGAIPDVRNLLMETQHDVNHIWLWQ
jgi:hypothetical protein